jgi:hypothetical protein
MTIDDAPTEAPEPPEPPEPPVPTPTHVCPTVTQALCTDSPHPVCPRCGTMASADLRTMDGVVTAGKFQTTRACASCHASYSVVTTVKITYTTALTLVGWAK